MPSSEEMSYTIENDITIYKEQFERNCERIRSLVDYHKYMNDLSKIIGCRQSIIKYFFTNPKLWMHLMYGPTQATQFRLKGPGKKVKLAKEIIYKLPPINHIVKAGLKGRAQYSFKAILPKGLHKFIYKTSY